MKKWIAMALMGLIYPLQFGGCSGAATWNTVPVEKDSAAEKIMADPRELSPAITMGPYLQEHFVPSDLKIRAYGFQQPGGAEEIRYKIFTSFTHKKIHPRDAEHRVICAVDFMKDGHRLQTVERTVNGYIRLDELASKRFLSEVPDTIHFRKIALIPIQKKEPAPQTRPAPSPSDRRIQESVTNNAQYVFTIETPNVVTIDGIRLTLSEMSGYLKAKSKPMRVQLVFPKDLDTEDLFKVMAVVRAAGVLDADIAIKAAAG